MLDNNSHSSDIHKENLRTKSSDDFNKSLKPIIFWSIVIAILAVAASTLATFLSAHPGEVLTGASELIKALAWPVAIMIAIATFRTPISNQFSRVSKITIPGGSVELERVVDLQLKGVKADSRNQSIDEIGSISQQDLSRARAVERATTEQNLPEIKNHMLDLATKYRQVRGSMPSGPERTREMSIVIAQMRTLGQAAYTIRGEFAFSEDPGNRLAAIAIAQVQPDLTMIGWLASRIGPTERPFIQYHALLAMLIAIRNTDAFGAVGLDHAYRIAQLGYDGLSAGEKTDRADLLHDIRSEVSHLRTAFPNQ